jgi:AcrR family transcriptional regulator
MARTINEDEYAVKRNQILDVAQRLVYTRGFDQMSIQDILDELKISKGAFYHYFDSKPALLDALILRVQVESEHLLYPILEDHSRSAVARLQCFFDTVGHWKTLQIDYMMALTRVLYSDDNALYRQKMVSTMIGRLIPKLADVIREGVAEGQLHTEYPEQAGAIAAAILQNLGDTLALWLMNAASQPDDLQYFETTVAAYTDAIERVLGAASGSIQLMDERSIREWTQVKTGTPASLPVFRREESNK